MFILQIPFLNVESVEKLSRESNEISNPGWIVHWVRRPTEHSTHGANATGFSLQPSAVCQLD